MRTISILGTIALSALLSSNAFAVLPANTFAIDPSMVITGELNYIVTTPTSNSVNQIVGANQFYNAGYSGSNAIMANVEGGHIWTGHVATAHATRAHGGGSIGADNSHPTRVGFVMGGRPLGTNLREGIAPDAALRSGALATSITGGGFSMSYTSFVYGYTNTHTGFGYVDVINSSWGTTDASGTGFITVALDALANNNPYTTFVVAAGNAGLPNTVGGPASGDNSISVGATANNGANVYDTVAFFSSRGPQDYADPVNGTVASARAPIDIVAPGHQLTLADMGGANTYAINNLGTSFAAPAVAGAVGLMTGAARAQNLSSNAFDARVIKANLMNGAAKLPGWNNGQVAHPNGNGGILTTVALHHIMGAGQLDLDRTYDQYLTGAKDVPGLNGGTTSSAVGWDFGQVTLGLSTDLVISTLLAGGTEFRATLTWFRDRDFDAVNGIAYDNAFADLNLQIWNSTFTTLYSESISLYNGSEHLAFTLPVTNMFGIRVTYPTNRFDFVGLTTEQYGLAWYATAVQAIPEPSVVMLFVLGCGAIWIRRRT